MDVRFGTWNIFLYKAGSLITVSKELSKFESIRAADCDTAQHLLLAEVRERLSVNKQRSHRPHMEKFNLKK
jgi:hypothetical protein